MQVKVIVESDRPARVVRVHKPRNGGGVTLGEFTNLDGRGLERAKAYVADRRHELKEVVVDDLTKQAELAMINSLLEPVG